MNYLIKNIKKCACLVAIASAIALCSSCEHKPLYILDDTPRTVRLIFDWENLRPQDTTPQGMHIVFTPDGSTDTPNYQYDVPTSTGLQANILPNDYIITGCSNDNPEVKITPVDGDIEIKCVEPENDVPALYALSQRELVENAISDDNGESPEQIIIAKPFPINCIYTIKVLNTQRVKNDVEWMASLSGLTNAIMLSNGKSSADAIEVTRRFALNSTVANERQTVLSLLGRLEGKDNLLKIKIKKQNETYSHFNIDVTSQINKAENPRNVLIVIDLNNYEEEFDEGTGSLNPAVDEFPETNEEITM